MNDKKIKLSLNDLERLVSACFEAIIEAWQFGRVELKKQSKNLLRE